MSDYSKSSDDEQLALALEKEKEEFREIVDEIQRAMLNDGEELTKEMADEFGEVAERNLGLADSL